MLKILNYWQNFIERPDKSVCIMKVIKLKGFELRKAKYLGFCKSNHDDFAFGQIMEVRIKEIPYWTIILLFECFVWINTLNMSL